MSRYLWILDAGHGGLVLGYPQTEGKRSPKWADGSQLFEGEFNRGVMFRLQEMMDRNNYLMLSKTMHNIDETLYDRITHANTAHIRHQLGLFGDPPIEGVILVSIHANAGGGRGFEVFTSPGETDSDSIATIFAEEFENEWPHVRIRSDYGDGDVDKEAKFKILTKTHCPAILLESFFMDNELECKEILMTPWGRAKIATAYFNAIKRIEENGF